MYVYIYIHIHTYTYTHTYTHTQNIYAANQHILNLDLGFGIPKQGDKSSHDVLPVQVRGFRRTLRTLGQRGLGFRFLFGVQGLFKGLYRT